jgi:hypothetical protein
MHMIKPRDRWRSWAGRLGLAGAPAALAVAYFLQGAHQGGLTWMAWVAIIVGTVLTLVVAVSARAAADRQARRTMSATALAESAQRNITRPVDSVFSAIAPVLEALQQVADAVNDDDRRLKKERLKQLTVFVAPNLGPNIRACYFEHGVENTPEGPLRVLRSTGGGLWYGAEGRRRPPRKEFRDDESVDIAGTDRFRILDERTVVFVKDVNQTPPPGWPSDRDYKTFIAAPVASETEIFGFLGVDSPEPGDLNRLHVEAVRQLARILAIGLSIN